MHIGVDRGLIGRRLSTDHMDIVFFSIIFAHTRFYLDLRVFRIQNGIYGGNGRTRFIDIL